MYYFSIMEGGRGPLLQLSVAHKQNLPLIFGTFSGKSKQSPGFASPIFIQSLWVPTTTPSPGIVISKNMYILKITSLLSYLLKTTKFCSGASIFLCWTFYTLSVLICFKTWLNTMTVITSNCFCCNSELFLITQNLMALSWIENTYYNWTLKEQKALIL